MTEQSQRHERSILRKYELTYLVSDEIPEKDLNKVTGKVTGFVDELGGKATKEDIWGRRKLIYPIKKQDFATYVTLYFDLPADKAIEFEKDLRHIDGILRQLMIVKETGPEALTLTAAEIADTEDIQEVIGGEKSFEAIKGQTEESRDLMSKREDSEDRAEAETEQPIVEEEIKVTETQEVETPAETVEKEEVKVPVKKKAVPKKAVIKEEKPAEKPKTEKVEEKAEKKVVKKAKASSDKKVSDEVERLSKLNEELDDILSDEL
jgi:small subunit ribosomal protein S6